MSAGGLAAKPAPAALAIEYYGFRFPNGARTESFTVEPVLDAAQRTIIYSKFRVTVSAYLNQGLGGTSDATVQSAIVLLTQPGGTFKYYGRGFGGINVNLKGASDCLWGPFPKVVSLDPLGSNQTVKIVWTIEFHLPTCADARYRGPMEFNYGTNITVDRSGLTSRVYKGFIRIANGRLNAQNRRVFDSADIWREKINPPLLAGFRRIPGTFELSHDKCKLDFSITDEELPGDNVPPANVIEVQSEHSYSPAQPGRIFDWVGNLSATYEIPKGSGLGEAAAVQAFKALAEDRLSQFLRLGQVVFGPAADVAIGFGLAVAVALLHGTKNLKRRAAIIPISFTVSDPTIYGQKRVHLEMRYRVAGIGLDQILNNGGLWRQVPGGDWQKWATSIAVPSGCRGLAGLRSYQPGEEEIVDLCARIPADPPKKAKPFDVELRTKKKLKDVDLRGGPKDAELRNGLFPAPAAADSWISYQASTRIEVDSGVVAFKTLPEEPLGPTSRAPVWDGLGGLPVGSDGSVSPSAARLDSTDRESGATHVQYRTTPAVYVYLSGYAMRAGFSIPQPELISMNGVELVSASRLDHGEFFEEAIVGQGGIDGSLPIVGARWNLRYLLPELPTQKRPLQIPPNPTIA